MKAAVKTEAIAEAQIVRARGKAPDWAVPTVRVGLVLTDILIAIGCLMGAFVIREGSPLLSDLGSGLNWSPLFLPYASLLVFLIPIRVLVFSYYNLYRLRGEFSFVDEGIRIFKAVSIGSLLLVAAAFLYRGGFAFRAFSYARGVFVLDYALALAAYTVSRFTVRGVQSAFRERGVNLIPTLVVGRGREAALFIKEVKERPILGYRIIGVVESEPLSSDTPSDFEGVPVLGDFGGLPDAIRESHANEVVITDPRISGDALFEVMMKVGRKRGVEFRIAPSLFNCLPRKTEIDQIGALPVITLFREPLSSAARLVKRASDIAVASIALFLLSPLWLLIALLIKLDSKGPVLFKQERVGMDGRVFLFFKFRSMHVDADDSSHREYQKLYISGNADTNLGNEEKPAYKLVSDSRVTRVGRVLRRLSMDELPQLLNVLLGDMSVVGPRPPIPYEVEAYELWHRKRLDMKPGLTGLWQVSGRNRLTFEEMVRLDLFYIENWSLLLDLRIILRTIPVMLRGDDAY
jgi:exopolysaccharide biosynthesis polyprenyl glycosylphosphotransferase